MTEFSSRRVENWNTGLTDADFLDLLQITGQNRIVGNLDASFLEQPGQFQRAGTLKCLGHRHTANTRAETLFQSFGNLHADPAAIDLCADNTPLIHPFDKLPLLLCERDALHATEVTDDRPMVVG
ncbi:MAG: hypothetical protein IH899_08985 [Planctomycetes bacterium]|nr:hypothetical protein [Planctomycetota bacterium]